MKEVKYADVKLGQKFFEKSIPGRIAGGWFMKISPNDDNRAVELIDFNIDYSFNDDTIVLIDEDDDRNKLLKLLSIAENNPDGLSFDMMDYLQVLRIRIKSGDANVTSTLNHKR